MARKICKNCGEKVNSKYSFCPNCGAPIRKNPQKDWGMLGKNDFENQSSSANPLLDSFTGKILNKMLGSAMKMLEKEMKKEFSQENIRPKTNVKLMINGKEINLNGVKNLQKNTEKKEKILDNFSKKSLKKFSELPKKEPKTNVKRFSNTVVYEINLPGVKSLKDLSILKLENSIEIKAVAKDKAYSKILPVNLLILDYGLEKGKLTLELEAKN